MLVGCPLHAEEHNLLLFTGVSVKGWGTHLGKVVRHREKSAYKHFGIESSILAIKSFQTHLLNKRVLVASDNAMVVSYLNKQGGTHSLEICLPLYVSPFPDPNTMGIDALNILWEALDSYAYCPIAPIPKLIKNENLCLPNDNSNPRVARDQLVLGPDRLINETSIASSSLGKSPKTTVQTFHQNLQYLNLHVWHLDSRPNYLKNSQSVSERIKAPQRLSYRRVCESRWTIFESWCKENQVDFHKPCLSSVADFFTYLFTDKNLKPNTIAGYGLLRII